MKKLLLVLLPIVLMLSSCGSAGDGNATTRKSEPTESQVTLRVSDYFPLNSDVYTKFKGTGNEYAEFETYVEYVNGNVVQKRVINPGTVSAVVYTVDDNELCRIFSLGETYYRYDFTNLTDFANFTDLTGQSENVEVLIKSPIKIGTSWTLGDGSTRTITSLDKKLSVVAGDFEALEITTVSKDYTTVDYYVKSTGLIKTEFKAAGAEPFTVVSELEKLTVNTPLKEQVRIFYPEFDKFRLIFTVNEIELFTNENAYAKLCALLKTAPEGYGLSNILSPNVKTNFVKLDEKNGICYVDFTEELISEMSAGSALESMILQCITNTFGVYYQKDKVIITVAGKPYEGGHIALMEGEYLSVKVDETTELKID